MKRLICLATALAVLGGCGAQISEERISPEKAQRIIAEIVRLRFDLDSDYEILDPIADEIPIARFCFGYETLDVIVDKQPNSGFNPKEGYYEIRVTHFNGYKTGIEGWFYVDCITGEPFETDSYGNGEWRSLN